jgi:hypothetical protein
VGGFYPFGGTQSLPSSVPNQSLGDVQIYEANPGVQLDGTETGALWGEFREAAGLIYIAQNARWNGSGWTQVNTAKASFAFGLDANGDFLFLTCAAANPSITWTTLFEIANTGTVTATGVVTTTGNQTVAGVKTFTSPPVMSGATITNATIPDAALVTAPVTAVTGSSNIASSGGPTPNITLVSAPTISGANIQTATIPDAALATAPVTAINVTAPITSTGGATPTIALTTPLSVANGGTGTAAPGLVAGTNIGISGAWPNETITATGSTGAVGYSFTGGSVGGTDHYVRGTVAISISSASFTGAATVSLSGAADFSSATSYDIMLTLNIAASGTTIPTGWTAWEINVYNSVRTASSFNIIVGSPNSSSSTGTIYVDVYAIGY